MPGIDSPHILATCDPVDGFEPNCDPAGNERKTDHPYLRETEAGIEVRRHPSLLVEDHPLLRRILHRYDSGAAQEIPFHHGLSAYELTCWNTLRAAGHRRSLFLAEQPAADDAARFHTLRSLGIAQ